MRNFFVLACIALFFASCSQKSETVKVETVQAVVDKKAIVIENMLSRRSVRSYKTEQVEKSKIDSILKYAIYAPSAKNKQPWEIRVIQNPETLSKIKELGGEFHGSPTLLVVAKDKTNAYGDFDCGILSQNIMLAAHAFDLGTCPLGSVGRLLTDPKAKDIAQTLDLPKDYEVILAISLGYPNESPESKAREESKIKFVD